MSLAPLQLGRHLAYLWGHTLVVGGDTLQLDAKGQCHDARVDLREVLLQSRDWTVAEEPEVVLERTEPSSVETDGPELSSGLRDRPRQPERMSGLKDRRHKDRH